MKRQTRKNFWEKVFAYPSFNIRFGSILILVLLLFITFGYIILGESKTAFSASDKIAILNLLIQSATLVLGIFAAYYALRQLVETRFIGLDEAGMQELKRNHYSRAFEKWREAFYIKPEGIVFTNMCEALLLVGDYKTFDNYIRLLEPSGKLNRNKMFQEISDEIGLLYLKIIRHLLIKNQGEAEKYLSELIVLIKTNGLPILTWDFSDLRGSVSYLNLNGECKNIAENLIIYLSKNMLPSRKIDFEAGNFASQVND